MDNDLFEKGLAPVLNTGAGRLVQKTSQYC